MKSKTMQIESPIDLPEQQIGSFEIRHSYHKELDVVSMREAVLTGKRPLKVVFDPPRLVHGLYELEDDVQALWIADWPIEIRQHREALEQMLVSGRVLVGGLGLGIMANLLAQEPRVEQVDVVEISQDVADLCTPRNPKVNVIVDDMYHWVENQEGWPYTTAFIDLWRGTNESTWWAEVLPLRRAIGQTCGPEALAHCQFWAEDQMLGQVAPRLLNATPPHWHYREELDLPMTMRRLRTFVNKAGTPSWERRYGPYVPTR